MGTTMELPRGCLTIFTLHDAIMLLVRIRPLTLDPYNEATEHVGFHRPGGGG